MVDALFPGLGASPNVHPVFVHFPVALWLVAAGAWVLWLSRRSDSLWTFGRWSLRLGLVGAVAAIASGYLAADAMGHDSPGHDLVHVHRNLMLWASGFALVTALVDHLMRHRSDLAARATLVVMGILTAVFLSVGADRGGELVFRYSIGTAGESLPVSDGHDHDHGDKHPHPANPAPAPAEAAPGEEDAGTDAAPAPKPPVPPGHEGHDHAH